MAQSKGQTSKSQGAQQAKNNNGQTQSANAQALTRLEKLVTTPADATILLNAGYHSALQIANQTQTQFATAIKGKLPTSGADTPQSIYSKAKSIQQAVHLQVASLYNLSSPFFKAMPSTNPKNEIIDFHKNLESYENLFGSQNYLETEKGRTIISPAAYLVDLLRYVEQYINQDKEALKLENRRPDLAKIPLNTENTYDEVPFLEVVNEIMIQKIQADLKSDNGLLNLAESVYPLDLPFNAPVEEIRLYLEAFKSSLYKVYKTFLDNDTEDIVFNKATLAREYLGLTPGKESLLTEPYQASEVLPLYGYNAPFWEQEPISLKIQISNVYQRENGNYVGLNNVSVYGLTDLKQGSQWTDLKTGGQVTTFALLPNDIIVGTGTPANKLIYKLDLKNISAGWSQTSVAGKDGTVDIISLTYMPDGKILGLSKGAKENSLYTIDTNLNTSSKWVIAKAPAKVNNENINQVIAQKNGFILGISEKGNLYSLKDPNSADAWESVLVDNPVVLQSVTETNNNALIAWDTSKKAYSSEGIIEIIKKPIYSVKNFLSATKLNPKELTALIEQGTGLKANKILPQIDGVMSITYLNDGNYWILQNTKISKLNGLTKKSTAKSINWDIGFVDLTISNVGEKWGIVFQNQIGKILPVTGGYNWYVADTGKETFSNMTFMSNGGVLAVCSTKGKEGQLYTIDPIVVGKTNTPIALTIPGNTQTFKAVSAFPNDTFLGVGTDNNLYYLDTLKSKNGWVAVDFLNETPLISVKILPDCKILGIDTQNKIIEITGFLPNIFASHFFINKHSQWDNEDGQQFNFISVSTKKQLINGLNLQTLDRLNRFIRLSNQLDWEYDQLDFVLSSMQIVDIKEKCIEELYPVKELENKLKLPIIELCSLWYNLKTFGKAPLFDKIFNQPTLFHQELGLAYNPAFANNPQYGFDILQWQPTEKDSLNNSLNVRLIAALELDSKGLLLLANYLFGVNKSLKDVSIPLSVENLSLLYRYSLLANTFKLTVEELLFLINLNYPDLNTPKKFFQPEEVINLEKWVKWMKKNKLDVYQLTYAAFYKSDVSDQNIPEATTLIQSLVNDLLYFNSKHLDKGFNINQVSNLLRKLTQAIKSLELKATDLTTSLLNKKLSAALYNSLQIGYSDAEDIINERGVFLVDQPLDFKDVSSYFFCEYLPYTSTHITSGVAIGKGRSSGKHAETGYFGIKTDEQLLTDFNEGTLSLWFKLGANQNGQVNLVTFGNTVNNNFNSLINIQVKKGAVSFIESQAGKILNTVTLKGTYNDGKWYQLFSSNKDSQIQLFDLSTSQIVATEPLKLQNQLTGEINIEIGNLQNASSGTYAHLAEVKLWDKSVGVKDLVSDTIKFLQNQQTQNQSEDDQKVTIPGLVNYWPLNDGMGKDHIVDLAGNNNGTVYGIPRWEIIYTIPKGFTSEFIVDDHLTKNFDQSSDTKLLPLRETIISVRNKIKHSLDNQRKGVIENIADYFKTDTTSTNILIDYVSQIDHTPQFVQRLLSYQFSLNWFQYEIDLEQQQPVLSTELAGAFKPHGFLLSNNAVIKRVDNQKKDLWLIADEKAQLFLLVRSEKVINVFKLPLIKEEIDYEPLNAKPVDFTIDPNNGIVVVTEQNGALQIKSDFKIPVTGPNGILELINKFIRDLGHLIYVNKLLGLTANDIKAILANPKRYFQNWNPDSVLSFSLAQIKELYIFKDFGTTLYGGKEALSKYLAKPDDEHVLKNDLTKLTGWDVAGIEALSEWFAHYLEFNPFSSDKIIDGDNLDSLGYAVAISENFAAVSAPESEMVLLFQLTGDNWQYIQTIEDPKTKDSNFGTSLAMEFNTSKNILNIVVGDYTLIGTGMAYIYSYTYDPKKNILKIKKGSPKPIQPKDLPDGSEFGKSIAINNDKIVIGAPNTNSGIGAAYLFKTTGTLIASQVLPQNSKMASFGNSVAINENFTIVADRSNISIYNSKFKELGTPVTHTNNRLSIFVSLSGNQIASRNPSDNNLVIYKIDDKGEIVKTKTIQCPDQTDKFGFTLSFNQNTIIVGSEQGGGYVFQDEYDSWIFKQKLVLNDNSNSQQNVSRLQLPIALSGENVLFGDRTNNEIKNINFYGVSHNLNWLQRADKCFNLSKLLGVDISFLLTFIRLSRLKIQIRANTEEIQKANALTFKEYQVYATNLRNVLKGHNAVTDWQKTYKSVNGKYITQERNALTSYMLWYLQKDYSGITNLEDLYEFLLIDVKMTSCANISYVKAAIDSVQLYIERVRTQLEVGASIYGKNSTSETTDTADIEWSWMSHFRVWQDNRKIFLYPENYINPSLLKGATKEYNDFKNALAQGDIDNEKAQAALHNYFVELSKLTKLEIVDICGHVSNQYLNGVNKQEYKYTVFGKEKGGHVYYFRTATSNSYNDDPSTWGNWSAWEKMDISIHAKNISSIYAFNKVFVFWTKYEKQMHSSEKGKSSDDSFGQTKTYNFQLKIYYSFLDVNGKWAQPLEFKSNNPEVSLLIENFGFKTFSYNIPFINKIEIFENLINQDAPPVLTGIGNQIFLFYPASLGTVGTLTPNLAVDFIDTANNLYFPLMPTFVNDLSTEYWCDINGNNLLTANGTITQVAGTGIMQGRNVAGFGGKSFFLFPTQITSNFFINKSFTVQAWINVSAIPVSGKQKTVIGTSTGGNSQNKGLQISVNSRKINGKDVGVIFMGFYNNDTFFDFQISTNTWYHVVWRYNKDDQSQDAFVNGVKCSVLVTNPMDTSVTPPVPNLKHAPFAGANQLAIGQFEGSNFFEGEIADLILWNSALADQQIKNLYDFNENGASPQIRNQINIGKITDKNTTPATTVLSEIEQLSDDVQTSQTYTDAQIQLFNRYLIAGGPQHFYKKQAGLITTDYFKASDTNKPNENCSSYEQYFKEVFYHIPSLVGQALNKNQKFDKAKQWYEFIYNPTANDTSGDRFWQYGMFRNRKLQSLKDILTNNSEIDAYDLDPLNPDAIANLRIGAYEKAIVMNYIDNLIDWADASFTTYTWETITFAKMLYVLAKNLLGEKPIQEGVFKPRKVEDFAEISAKYKNDIPQFYIQVEDNTALPTTKISGKPNNLLSGVYFTVPENMVYAKYWDKINKMLFDIRHCLNKEGEPEPLSLFAPPINPNALLNGAGDVPVSVATEIPYYRFSYMVAQAKSVTSRLVQLGSLLLSTLEKKDAEALAMLRNTHEKEVLNLVSKLKESAIKETTENGQVLQISLNNANYRLQHYQDLITQSLSPLEKESLNLNSAAMDIQIGTTVLRVGASIAHLIPTVYGFADGDFTPGGAVDSAAAALDSTAGILNSNAAILATKAGYARRAEDWSLQEQLSQFEVSQIQQQIAINKLQLEAANQELSIHKKEVNDNEAIENYYTSKFTNEQLYEWMIDKVTTIYFQTYKIAHELAKKAEIAFQFELNSNEAFIGNNNWDTMKKGLLAGEGLQLSLDMLERAHVTENQRRLEIQKTISLKQIAPEALINLKKKGKCIFNLSERLFDFDFPGHYDRKIKTISITVPAVVGPYQTIKATLIQQTNNVVLKPELEAVKYLLPKNKNQNGNQPSTDVLRSNWRPNQQVALSKANQANGLFELNFADARYLPFEGTGAVSTWELKLPKATNQFNFNSISDVIINLEYTALDGGVTFAQQVVNTTAMQNFEGSRTISLRQDFASQWAAFIKNDNMTFQLTEDMFPANILASSLKLDPNPTTKANEALLVVISNDSSFKPTGITLNGNQWSDTTGIVDIGSKNTLFDPWKLVAAAANKGKIIDIQIVVKYAGSPDWGSGF